MKLLFDQNISFRIIKKVEDFLPSSSQVRLLGLENSNDIDIWEFAKAHDFNIVTFDTDFYDNEIDSPTNSLNVCKVMVTI